VAGIVAVAPTEGRLAGRPTALWRQLLRNPRGAIGLAGLVWFVGIAIAGAILYKNPLPTGTTSASVFLQPSKTYWLGTDQLGRNVFDEIMLGAQVSVIVGFAATVLATILGAVIGVTSGYFSGPADTVLMRGTDVALALPALPLMVVLAAILPRGLLTVIGVIAVTSWPGPARIIRSGVLSERERTYILRARAVGCRERRILWRYIVPAVMPLILANAALLTAVAVLNEAVLAFLGLSDPTHASWGNLLQGAFNGGAMLQGAWWVIVPPGLCIVSLVLSFTLLSNAMSQVLNPRLNAS
jgi:peptide/nickel transport system permease protein